MPETRLSGLATILIEYKLTESLNYNEVINQCTNIKDEYLFNWGMWIQLFLSQFSHIEFKLIF